MMFIAILILFVGGSHATPKNLVNDGKFELIILHNNDMHARFEQTNVNSTKCTTKDAEANQCYGGFARVAHEVRKHRKQAETDGTSILYLNAGDTYTGSLWFQLYKDNITSTLLNALQPDAMALGNHEFDEGIKNLGKFLNQLNFPVLVSNINIDNEPDLDSVNLKKSIVLERNGRKIGIIGYLTPETKLVGMHNEVEYEDEIIAINKEAENLIRDGVNIIIALGHSGLPKDKIIAAECEDVDLVIGAHSHSFMYSGTPPSNDIPVDDYPLTITQKSGKKVPVVQAFAFTKYLGKLHLIFDNEGNLQEIDGQIILLDKDVPQDDDVLKLLDFYRPGIEEFQQRISRLLSIGSAQMSEEVRRRRGGKKSMKYMRRESK